MHSPASSVGPRSLEGRGAGFFVTGLTCLRCGTRSSFALDAYVCPDCGAGGEHADPGVLDVGYDYEGAAERFPGPRPSPRREPEAAPLDLFRWQALLPVARPAAPLLPVLATPLVAAPRVARRLGLRALFLKDETRHPTRCLKDRATAVAVTAARAIGVRQLYCASAGNAAISLAGFCAQADFACHAFVAESTPARRLAWLRRFGAEVHVGGSDYDAAVDAAEAEGRRRGWYSRTCALNPLLVEGKKTAAFEIAEALEWAAPDLVAAPVGDGCTLGAIGKGFRELQRLGRTERLPRLVGVQSEGVQPLVRRFLGEPAGEPLPSRAFSIAVRRPRNALRLLAELTASGGTLLAVDDDTLERAARSLAAEAGVVAELTAAAGLAGLERLAERESLEGRVAVVVVTGGRPDADA